MNCTGPPVGRPGHGGFMPNWCECDLYITGPKEELEKFLETVKSEESVFDFNRVIPYPEHFRELDGPFRGSAKTYPDGVSWSCSRRKQIMQAARVFHASWMTIRRS